MTKFVRNSRLRRVVSTMCSVALLASLVVMPTSAGAVVDSYVTSVTQYGGNITVVEGTNEHGLSGTYTFYTTGTPAAQAQQQSVNAYNASSQTSTTLGGSGAFGMSVTHFPLYVSVYSPAFGDVLGSDVSTTIPVPGITAATTLAELANKIDAALDLVDTGNDEFLIAGDAFFTSNGNLRVVKRFAEQDSEIWVHSGTDPNDVTTDPAGQLSTAEAVFGDSLIVWGRYSPFGDTYKYGTDNVGYTMDATFTPSFGTAYSMPDAWDYATWGSFDNGVYGWDNFRSGADTSTGLYTAVVYERGGQEFLFATNARGTAIIGGTTIFEVGDGAREAKYSSCPDVYPAASVIPTVGAVTTWTVDAYMGDAGSSWNRLQHAYNGISVLFPKEFTLVNGPNHADFIADLAASFGSTPTVTTSATAEGYLVTMSNFVKRGNLSFNVALKAPDQAGYTSTGAKIWVHHVGSPWTDSPVDTQLINAKYPDEQTDWFPLFCDCGTIGMEVAPDVAKTITLEADVNRAEGYTALVASAVDQFGNDVSSYVNYSAPVLSPAAGTDGVNLDAGNPGEWIWQYAKTPGVNSASITADDVRTPADDKLPASVSNNTSGIGEPAKVVILPTDDEWASGSSPTFQIQLQDAQGNPTSWLDQHDVSTDWFQLNAHSQNNEFPQGLSVRNRYIWRGWSKSSGNVWGTADLFGADTTSWNAWPTNFAFGMTAQGPDTWTISAKHRSGSVMPAAFVTIDITGQDPALVGVPAGFKVTAVKKAPAEYAWWDDIYNNKDDDYADDAFGYAAAGGQEKIVLEARVVDAYGNTITKDTAGIPVRFEVPKFDRTNAILPTGHVYETTTTAGGVATVEVISYEPTLDTRWVPNWGYSWFTPVRATTTVFGSGADWANPCGETNYYEGYGFTYFHGARVTAELAETPEGDDKNIVLADGVDTTSYHVEVLDSAFNTPIKDWDVKFTTSFGTFAEGSQAVTKTTDDLGHAMVTVKSGTAGRAFLRTFDRWRNAFTTAVDFTDYATKYSVLDSTVRAGDRAEARVLVWAENIKETDAAKKRVQWDWAGLQNSDFSWYADDVYGYDADNTHGDGVNVPQWTNEIDVNDWAVDTDNNGKADALEITIPAYDDSGIRFESAGKRYAVLGGSFYTGSDFNNVFYDWMEFVAAPARPEVNFVKEAKLVAEGTQLSNGISLSGDGFTPGRFAPDYSDQVEMFLGDITTGDTIDLLGWAWVGKDGKLLPAAVLNERLSTLSPGTYDITVDGLVFKGGLEIKNLFSNASITILGKRSGVAYLAPRTSYRFQVNALGALDNEVWVDGVKLAKTQTTGWYTLDTSRLSPGKHTITAQVTWPIAGGMFAKNSPDQIYYGGSFRSVITRTIYVRNTLAMSAPAMTASGRTLTVRGRVAGAAEVNGSKRFKMTVQYQKLVNGRWTNYGKARTAYSNGAATNSYVSSMRVLSAGTYRARVSHGDAAHYTRTRFSGSRTVR